MNFDDAIIAHTGWKQKLSAYLSKPDRSIDPTKLERDDQCELGKWIHGAEGASYKSEPGFQELTKVHAGFHRAAAGVVRRADAGQNVSSEVALGGSSDYSVQSGRVVALLMQMRAKMATVKR